MGTLKVKLPGGRCLTVVGTEGFEDGFYQDLDDKAATLGQGDEEAFGKSLTDFIRRVVHSAWERYYEIIITPGYVLTATSAQPVERNARGPAVLIFVGKPESRDIIEDAIEASSGGNPVTYFPDAVANIKKIDESDYPKSGSWPTGRHIELTFSQRMVASHAA